MTGIGWVLRDDSGCFLAAKNVKLSGLFDVKIAEAIGVREALSWLMDTGMGTVDVETDSQLLFNALSCNSFLSDFGLIVDDIKELASLVNDVEFGFVKPSANCAAHSVAKEAFSESGCGEWFDIPPDFLVDCLTSSKHEFCGLNISKSNSALETLKTSTIIHYWVNGWPGLYFRFRPVPSAVPAVHRRLAEQMLQSSHTATQLTVSLSSCSRQETHKIRSSPKFSMRAAFSFLHTFSVSVLLNTTRSGRWNRRDLFCTASLLRNSSSTSSHLGFHPRRPVYCSTLRSSSPSASTFVEQLVCEPKESLKHEEDLSSSTEREIFNFDSSFESVELKRFDSPVVDVKELEDLPEQWRRSRLAWLCKELPAHKHNTLIRILNAQRKWLRQEDATYIVCHCMRIRENEAAFRVYKWMMLQHWFQFDFALATRLADYLGKERKYLKCREVYDDILNQGRVPAESTFHILVVAYLSSSGQSVVEEAFSIYSRMIQLGGYRPRLSLHNSLFKALVGKQGGSFEETLKQAEFIYHNLTTSGLQIHKDIYGGLIWLHSYQDLIDKDRIALLRTEMRLRGIEESTDVLVSVLRACSKNGDAEEAERTWSKLLSSNPSPPPQAFMFRMVTYAKIGEHMKCLEIFRRMQEELGSTAAIAYHKIIEVLSKAEKLELAELIMTEFIDSGLGPLRPSFIDMMKMYSTLGLHEKLESTFFQCLKKCCPNRKVFSIYLDSLVQIGSINKAGEVFNQMIGNTSIGVNAHCCNSILRGYLSQGEHIKAEKLYRLMCLKKYDIDSSLIEKLSFVLSLRQKDVKEPIRQKLSIEQREVMVGLLLGGLQIKSDAERKKHLVHFEFSENLKHHSVLRRHIYDKYREWLACPDKLADDDDDDVPWVFTTIPHSYFGFYADQFWRKGQPTIPKLIHRWLSPRVLAYWYMYSGYRTSSGDILLRLKGSQEGIENIVKILKAKSLDCRLKTKGSSFWIGFLGDKSTWFWKLVEPFILDDLKDCLRPGGNLSDDLEGIQTIDSGSESDEKHSECSDGEM